MKPNNLSALRAFLLLVAIAAGIYSATLAQMQAGYMHYENMNNHIIVDSGLNGGACGMGILSGLSLVALSITYLKKE